MVRVTNVITSIDSNTNESVTVNSTSWSTDNGTITLSATVPAAVFIGDVITDSAGNSYLITGISGSDLTCQDFDSTTDPATGSATIVEAYATITLWETDLDAGTNSEVYKSGDTARGQMHNNAAFNESPIINGGETIGLVAVYLEAAPGEEHDGTAGSGARIVRSDITGTILTVTTVNNGADRHVVGLEFDGNGGRTDPLALFQGNSNCKLVVRRNLFHSASNGFGNNCAGVSDSFGGTEFYNNAIYDFALTSTSNIVLQGFRTGTLRTMKFQNNVVDNITKSGSLGTCEGVEIQDDSDYTYQNNIAMRATGGATATDYSDSSPTNATVDHNTSSDSTASGTGSLTNKSATNQFVSIVAGSEDYHLKSGAEAIDAGTDLGSGDVAEDIDGFNRHTDTSRDPWDQGMHEFDSGGAPDVFSDHLLMVF